MIADVDESSTFREYENTRQLFDSFVQIIENPYDTHGKSETGLHAMLRDIALGLQKLGERSWLNRFILSMQHFHEGCIEESVIRADESLPTLEDYIDLRTSTAGMYQAFDLIEFANQSYLPLRIVYNIDFCRLRTLAVQITAWGNDFCSYTKEMNFAEVTNLLNIIMAHEDCSLEAAVDIAATLHNNQVDEYAELEKSLKGKFNIEVFHQYCACLQGWMKGALEWGKMSPRYH